MDYRPQSPDLGGVRPQSPDLMGRKPQKFGGGRFGGPLEGATVSHAAYPTSQPAAFKAEPEDDAEIDYLPPSSKRARKGPQPGRLMTTNGAAREQFRDGLQPDPTLGVQVKTTFPVARIKRLMQQDEDIGKVAQVTPHVVTRALELFIIKLVSSAANQAQGPASGAGGKFQRRIQAQHLKRAIMTDDQLDFLREIANKVPDAPSKAKKEAGSESEPEPKVKKGKTKKRKDSSDGF